MSAILAWIWSSLIAASLRPTQCVWRVVRTVVPVRVRVVVTVTRVTLVRRIVAASLCVVRAFPYILSIGP